MCKQVIPVSAAGDNAVTLAKTGPILDVRDQRLELNTPEMQRRRRVLAIIGAKFPAADGHADAKAPFSQGRMKSMKKTLFCGGPGNTCTDVNSFVMTNKLGGVGAKGNWGSQISSNPAFVPFQEGRLPSVGDTYNLFGVKDGMFHHCGIICKVGYTPNDFWIVADGGQGFPEFGRDGARPQNQVEAAYLLVRTSYCVDTPSGHQMRLVHYSSSKPGGGGHRLAGWVNLGDPSVRFENEGAFDAHGSREDYERAKKRILRVEDLAPAALKFYQDPSQPTFRPEDPDEPA